MSLTVKGFASRGLVAGAAGGLAAGLFIRFVTERQIDVALRFEDAATLGGPSGGPAAVSRSTQQWGGVAAAVLYGAVLGVALAVAVAALHHRVRARSEFDRVAKLAAAAFVAVVLVPGLKYPPNPPAVGDPDTIGERTRLYLSLMGTSVLIVFAAWVLWENLTERGVLGAPRAMAVGAAFTLVVALAFVLWPPSPDTVAPPDNEAAPALRIADDAPAPVLDAMLDTARSTRDDWIRDPGDPSEPLDLHAVDDPSDLAGAPGAVSTGELVPHSFTTAVWHFRLLTLAGLALMVSVMAAVLGLLLDLPSGAG
ncbi:MAG TPA: CbtA family protein, partial [Acidimicrobiales bacterium]